MFPELCEKLGQCTWKNITLQELTWREQQIFNFLWRGCRKCSVWGVNEKFVLSHSFAALKGLLCFTCHSIPWYLGCDKFKTEVIAITPSPTATAWGSQVTPQPGDSRGAPDLGLQHHSRRGEQFHPCTDGEEQEAPIYCLCLLGWQWGQSTGSGIFILKVARCIFILKITRERGVTHTQWWDIPSKASQGHSWPVHSAGATPGEKHHPSIPLQSTPCPRAAAQGWEGTRGTRGGPERGRARAHPAPAGRAEPPAPSRGL